METKNKGGRPKGTGRPTTKMNKSEVLLFIDESVKKILDEHMSWKEYIRWCEKHKISYSMANKYWKESWESIQTKYELDRNKQVTKHLKKYWKIHDDAINRGDLNTARLTLNDIAKLMGLNEPDKVDITDKIIFNFGEDGDE